MFTLLQYTVRPIKRTTLKIGVWASLDIFQLQALLANGLRHKMAKFESCSLKIASRSYKNQSEGGKITFCTFSSCFSAGSNLPWGSFYFFFLIASFHILEVFYNILLLKNKNQSEGGKNFLCPVSTCFGAGSNIPWGNFFFSFLFASFHILEVFYNIQLLKIAKIMHFEQISIVFRSQEEPLKCVRLIS